LAVKINEPWADVLAGDVANIRAASRVEFGPDLGDAAARDTDISQLIERLRRVDHLRAGQ
jgi:hypothetical protein